MNASSKPAMMAGAMIGRVTVANTFHGGAPRSIAASSSERSKPIRRACTTTVTKHMENVVCAIAIVQKPRSEIDGDEQQQQRQADDHLGHHQRRIDHAAEQRAAEEALVLDSAKAASVPSTTAPQAVKKAIFRLTQAAVIVLVAQQRGIPLQREAAPDVAGGNR